MYPFETLLGLRIAIQLFFPAEKLARQLQSKASTPCCALNGAELLVEHLQNLRSDQTFCELYDGASNLAIELEIPDTTQPRPRRIPARYESNGEPHPMCPVDRDIQETCKKWLLCSDRQIADKYQRSVSAAGHFVCNCTRENRQWNHGKRQYS